MSSETISPTAHYTGYAWFAHGLSDAAFATPAGRRMYQALWAPNAAARALRLPTLEGLLIARHRLIDLRLQQAIDAGEISQVIEVACGLSPRGWRFCSNYGDALTYVEADLPGMLANKRRILARLGGETAHHRTVEVDALADSGPTSIAAICASLDPARGTAILTEGLINYFARDQVTGMWRRFAGALAGFPRGVYLSDLILRDPKRSVFEKTFTRMLARFVKGGVHVDFTSAEDAELALEAAGFDGVVLDPRAFEDELPGLESPSAGRVRVLEARARRRAG
jgi:O-methyltransferase involved in polyketide biosynthesis